MPLARARARVCRKPARRGEENAEALSLRTEIYCDRVIARGRAARVNCAYKFREFQRASGKEMSRYGKRSIQKGRAYRLARAGCNALSPRSISLSYPGSFFQRRSESAVIFYVRAIARPSAIKPTRRTAQVPRYVDDATIVYVTRDSGRINSRINAIGRASRLDIYIAFDATVAAVSREEFIFSDTSYRRRSYYRGAVSGLTAALFAKSKYGSLRNNPRISHARLLKFDVRRI